MANGSRHSMAFVAEATYGVTPASPAFKALRHTSAALALSKELLESEELRSDREVVDVRHGAFQVGGDMGFELSYGSFDDFFQGLLGGTWSTAHDTGAAIQIAATVGTFTRATGSFVTDGFVIGDLVSATGFTNPGNLGRFTVTAVAALTLTVSPAQGQTMVVEAAGARQIKSSSNVRTGVTRRSFTIERNFGDILSADKPYHRFTGVELNGMELQVNANAMVTGTFNFVGQGINLGTAILAGATYVAAPTTSPLDSFTGTLTEGGTAIAVITEISLTVENGLEPRFVVGSKQSLQPSIGRAKISGSVTAFFENSTLLDKFVNETESSLEFTLPDAAGNAYRVFLPRIKYTGGQPDVSGEGPVTLSMPFMALRHPGVGYSMVLEK